MPKASVQRKTGTPTAMRQDEALRGASEAQTAASNDSPETQSALGPAYRRYVEGRKGLARAFKDREYSDEEACKDAERRFQVCEETIDKAVRAREKAEQDASEEYGEHIGKAVEKAAQAYREKTGQALSECKQKVMDAWSRSTDVALEVNGVYEEEIEKAMLAREKADLEALTAYRQEVDKAVEKASQVYTERLMQALSECRQRVTDAWKHSMQASARMSGIFEDRTTSTEDAYTENRPEDLTPQLREALSHLNGRVQSIARRAIKALS